MPAKRTTSKKRSDANSTSPWPRDVVLFVDRCLGRFDVPGALRAAGATVEVHHDHFEHDSPDTAWLPVVGKRNWLVITGDRDFRHNYLELVALFRGNVKAFVFSGKNMAGPAIGQALVKALKHIYFFGNKFESPFIANVTDSGSVTMAWHRPQLYQAVFDKAPIKPAPTFRPRD
ncbi:MAG: hypothetical protein JSS27_21285 [Planctomycetes bacterium]|nr:hypothetical protein [Planctomycetota bacterium]